MKRVYVKKWDNGIHDGSGYVFKMAGFYVFTPDHVHFYHITKGDFKYV